MRRGVLSFLLGGAVTYLGGQLYGQAKPSRGLDSESMALIDTYLGHYNLKGLMSQSLMNGYMQLNHSFLDYGIR